MRAGAKLGRGHVAARFAGQSLGPRARRVAIKSRLVVLAREGPRSIAQYLRYVQRDSAAREGDKGVLYGPYTESADRVDFQKRIANDRHHFRIIVSPADGAELGNLTAYTRQLMAQMERDLGTRLDWVAANHWDTEHPHVHLVLRGKDEAGEDLVIARDYIGHGMRHRAAEVATEWLGPRTDAEIRRSLMLEVNQERWTSLDQTLKQETRKGRVVLEGQPLRVEARFQRSLLIGRLDRLAAMGLAERAERGVWQVAPALEQTLRTMGERSDIIRTMQRAFSGRSREFAIFDPGDTHAGATGRIAAKGVSNELNDRAYLVVDGVDGRAHYVRLPPHLDPESFPIGGIVEIAQAAEPRPADRSIECASENGLYRTERHLQQARQQLGEDVDPQAFVDAHVRRLEALRRAGIVERVEEGVWRVPPDLLARGQAYDAHRNGSVRIDLKSQIPIERQVRTIGATWLDQQLFRPPDAATQKGFGAEVRTTLAQRVDFLVEQGLAERRGPSTILTRNLLQKLRARELAAVAGSIANETGTHHKPLVEGVATTGTYRRSLNLASGRYALLDDANGFSLVPWRPVLEKRVGHSITATLRGERVSFEFGRQRGLSR